jgi:SpoIID/LytB domain protein
MKSRAAALVASTALAIGAAVLSPSVGASAEVAAVVKATTIGPSVVLVGHGYGHGRGMGQWGAYGYAVDQGWTSAMILDHYYGGTKPGSIGPASIGVYLDSLDGKTSTWITSSKDFAVGGIPVDGGSAARILKTTTGWAINTAHGGCAPWDLWGPTVRTSPTVAVKLIPQAGTTSADTLVTCSNQRGYRGALSMVSVGSTPHLVNTLPMQEYLRGVVPSESYPSWGDARGGWGIEALKAQAVAARGYAWTDNRYSSFARTCDTIRCQVYGGATVKGLSVADPRTDKAIAATAGLVRVDSTGKVMHTEFSSSTGGYTAGGAFPSVPDLGDRQAPNHTWTVSLGGGDLAAKYGLGTFRQLRITRQNGLGAGGGRVLEVTIVGTTSSKVLTGGQFRTAFGLRSDWFFPAVQPIQQVTSLSYVKTKFAPNVYRQFGYAGWKDHGWVTADDYAAAGRPAVTAIPAANVKYTWSPTQYVVTDWPTEPTDETYTLTWERWQAAGAPSPARAGNVYGTMFYRNGANLAIYARAPDDSIHHLTPAEWAAAGWPKPVIR